jgi:hypothetical protein
MIDDDAPQRIVRHDARDLEASDGTFGTVAWWMSAATAFFERVSRPQVYLGSLGI